MSLCYSIIFKESKLSYYDVFANHRDTHHEINNTVVLGNADKASDNNEDLIEGPERYMVVSGSLKSKLPPTLIIKSANLRVLDPIGQGLAFIFLSYIMSYVNIMFQVNLA